MNAVSPSTKKDNRGLKAEVIQTGRERDAAERKVTSTELIVTELRAKEAHLEDKVQTETKRADKAEAKVVRLEGVVTDLQKQLAEKREESIKFFAKAVASEKIAGAQQSQMQHLAYEKGAQHSSGPR